MHHLALRASSRSEIDKSKRISSQRLQQRKGQVARTIKAQGCSDVTSCHRAANASPSRLSPVNGAISRTTYRSPRTVDLTTNIAPKNEEIEQGQVSGGLLPPARPLLKRDAHPRLLRTDPLQPCTIPGHFPENLNEGEEKYVHTLIQPYPLHRKTKYDHIFSRDGHQPNAQALRGRVGWHRRREADPALAAGAGSWPHTHAQDSRSRSPIPLVVYCTDAVGRHHGRGTADCVSIVFTLLSHRSLRFVWSHDIQLVLRVQATRDQAFSCATFLGGSHMCRSFSSTEY